MVTGASPLPLTGAGFSGALANTRVGTSAEREGQGDRHPTSSQITLIWLGNNVRKKFLLLSSSTVDPRDMGLSVAIVSG